MAKIYAPNKQYVGVSAGVPFINGVGECTNPYLLDWFKSKGYEIEEVEEPEDDGKQYDIPELEDMTIEELQAYAEEKGIDLGKATSQEGILKKILEAEEVEEPEDDVE